jgi:diketogulonate reductase-like aldo/keto reductase
MPKSLNIPSMIYGTAWKEEKTHPLVIDAIKAGFRAIDTANQRKHYHEQGVGDALDELINQKLIKREDIFLQSKFTHIDGQDHRLPYDREASCSEQVLQSFASSLEHLKTDYLDSYLIHGPAGYPDLCDSDLKVWTTMESLVDAGKALSIGISNVNVQQLHQLWEGSRIKPQFVQNRCFANRKWDWDVRQFCQKNGIVYQGFSLLTANPEVLNDVLIGNIAAQLNKNIEQIVFRLAQQLSILPLTGTTQSEHMVGDLDLTGIDLSADQLTQLEVQFS